MPGHMCSLFLRKPALPFEANLRNNLHPFAQTNLFSGEFAQTYTSHQVSSTRTSILYSDQTYSISSLGTKNSIVGGLAHNSRQHSLSFATASNCCAIFMAGNRCKSIYICGVWVAATASPAIPIPVSNSARSRSFLHWVFAHPAKIHTGDPNQGTYYPSICQTIAKNVVNYWQWKMFSLYKPENMQKML